MSEIVALPVRGEVFLDARDNGRAMRLSWHHEADLVVFSLWRESTCVASFQLSPDDVPALVQCLVTGLATGYQGQTTASPQAV